MTKPPKEALDVMVELRKFRDGMDEIMNMVAGKSFVSRDEKGFLQEKFKLLKSNLKDAAKRKPRNQFESSYFEPAVRKAAANLLIATNSHPIRSNWHSALYSTRIDITYYLFQLEQQFPDA